MALQDKRFLTRLGFFALFILAPPLDIFRIDLTQGHPVLFGQPWTLGLGPFLAGEAGVWDAAWNLFWRGFLPLFGGAGLFLLAAWRYGRLYCGWLCPHFSVVEAINGLMLRAFGRPPLWEREPLPARRPDGTRRRTDRRWWPLTLTAVAFFSGLWAAVLLTYLLPPSEVYHNLLTGDLTRNQGIFLGAATAVLLIELLLARHLFCRYGCAVGIFQSLAWMANRRAMVVGFDRSRAAACAACSAACREVQADNPHGSLLEWVDGACALNVSDQGFGRKPRVPEDCFTTGGAPRIVYQD